MYYKSKLRNEISNAVQDVDHKDRLKIQSAIARERYENESDEVKAKVRAEMEDLRKLDESSNLPLGTNDLLEHSDVLREYVRYLLISTHS